MSDNSQQTHTEQDVSRETLPNSRRSKNAERHETRRRKALSNLRSKGGITDDNPYDFNNPTLKELYRDFRNNKLSRHESAYNALYLWCTDNYYSSGVPLKNKYKNIYAHPSAWFMNASHMWRHNKWSVAVKVLEMLPAFSRAIQDAKRQRETARESFWQTFEYSRTSSSKALGLLITIASVAGTAAMLGAWTNSFDELKRIPALELYVDNEYVGDILSINEAEAAKDGVEQSLSANLGTSYRLDCDVSFKPTRIEKGRNLTPVKISKAFSNAAHEGMQFGYGLYAYDVLIAVSPNRAWLDDSINESLELRLSEQQRKDSSIEKVSYNNFIIREGSFPADMFSTRNNIRSLFSLPIITDEEKNALISSDIGSFTAESAAATDNSDASPEISDYLNVSDKATLLTGSNPIGTSSDVVSEGESDGHKIAIETVITRAETKTEPIPFGTDYIYDSTLAENKQTLVSRGTNGSKTAVYLIDYVGDKEISRHTLSEVVISQPTNQVVIKGTRPLTEEEKRVKSTGKYIYPNGGEISSPYGWRTFGGYNSFHRGLDIRNTAGLTLVASDGGEVIQAHDRGDGYGLCVMIRHDNGHVTRYAHCSQIFVETGQMVAQGEHIADMGETGMASGVHIHFEIIIDGVAVNPLDYLEPKS